MAVRRLQVEKLTKYNLLEKVKTSIKKVRAAVNKGRSAIKMQVEDKIEEGGTDEQGNYRFTAFIKATQHSYTSRDSLSDQLERLVKRLKPALERGGWRYVGEVPLGGKPLKGPVPEKKSPQEVLNERPPLKLPKLTPEIFAKYFNGIYERDAYIRVIYDSLRAYSESKRKKRSHILLYGEPASCKTTLFMRFKEWIEKENNDGTERIALLDATTMTKAGFELWLIKRANGTEPGGLPDVVIIEEIEKNNPDALLSLLSVMDQRQTIGRLNARVGHATAKAPVLIWATCNDHDELKKFHKGALFSRFSHAYLTQRPSWALLEKIMLREVKEYGGKEEWVKPAIQLAKEIYEQEDINGRVTRPDPRRAASLLDGGDRLLNGSYQQDIKEIYKTTGLLSEE